jgi:hypothetical protein
MGVLADLFVATDAEVLALTPDDLPFERFRTLDLKGFTDVEFATLNAQIRGLKFEDVLDDLMEFHALDETEGPWILRFEDAFVHALAALKDASLASHAQAWGSTEELEDWDANDLLERLEGIVKLAREAVQQGKNLFLWNSL